MPRPGCPGDPSRPPRHRSPVMKKLLAVLALTGLFAAGTFTAIAQAPKKDDTKKEEPKKDDAKKSDSKSTGKGSITIKPDAKGKYRILIKDADGKGMLMTAGSGYETEKEAREAVEEAKSILSAAKITVEKGE